VVHLATDGGGQLLGRLLVAAIYHYLGRCCILDTFALDNLHDLGNHARVISSLLGTLTKHILTFVLNLNGLDLILDVWPRGAITDGLVLPWDVC
jgi:hypothetical protein